MNNSQFIDQTIEKLTKQNAYGYGDLVAAPYTHMTSCLYRTPKGHSCAIGVWLTEDQAVNADTLGLSATAVREEYPDIFNGVDPALMEAVQLIHDHHAEMNLTMGECTVKLATLKAIYPD